VGRYTIGARVWVGITSGIALLLATWSLRDLGLTQSDLIAFAVLSICGGIAHGFPIRSIFDGASIRLTNVFIVAGAAVLPVGLVTLLPIAAITPDTIIKRRNPGALTRWSFNVSQTVIASLATSIFVRWASGAAQDDLLYLGALVVAALLFSAVQALMVGIVISLNSRIPLRQADTFTLPHLQGSVLMTMLGALVGGLWAARPVLLVLVLPLILLAYFLSKTAHLSYLAQVDAKTGLHNYRHFEHHLEEELRRSHRLGRPLSILFFDLDLLRNVNNTHGHLAGDKVLLALGRLLTQTLRKGDVIARFGGEEFVALLPGTDAEEAAHVAERVRQAVAEHPFEIEPGRVIHCTISAGVAACPDDATDVAGLIKQADLAMYRAKQTRNAVCRVRVLPPVPRVNMPPGQMAESPVKRVATPIRSALAPVALWVTVGAGLAVALASLLLVWRANAWLTVLPFMGLAGAAECIRERVFESGHEKITMSFTIAVTMAAVTVVPAGAPLASLTAALVHVFFVQHQRQVEKSVFNLANPTLAAGAAALTFSAIRTTAGPISPAYIAAAIAAVIAFHVVNFGLINVMISLHTGRRLRTLISDSGWYTPTKLFLGLTGAFLGSVYAVHGPVGVVMFVVPLVILRHSAGLYVKRTESAIAQLKSAKEEVEQAHFKKEETLRQLIETVAKIVDARDSAVLGHSQRVARYSVAMAQEMGLTPGELAVIHTAGLLHDMGKIAVPEAILNKPDRLTPEEYRLVKEHAAVGERILSEVAPLGDVARIVGEHHERWDGTGYPRGRAAGEISLGGRIMSVADTLDTILSDRPYARARDFDWALHEIDRCAGTQFDPEAVKALHRLVAERGPEFFGQPTRPAAKTEELVS